MKKKNNALLIAAVAGLGAYYLSKQGAFGSSAAPSGVSLTPPGEITPVVAENFWSTVGTTAASNLTAPGAIYSSTGVPVIPTSAGDKYPTTYSVPPAGTTTTTTTTGTTAGVPAGYYRDASGTVRVIPAGYYVDADGTLKQITSRLLALKYAAQKLEDVSRPVLE